MVEGRGVGAHGTRLSERDRPHDPATWSLDVGPARQNDDGPREGQVGGVRWGVPL